MTQEKDGGPAFPTMAAGPQDDFYHQEGMSLLDYIAVHAMVGILSDSKNVSPKDTAKEISEAAYSLGRAMLAERERTHEP